MAMNDLIHAILGLVVFVVFVVFLLMVLGDYVGIFFVAVDCCIWVVFNFYRRLPRREFVWLHVLGRLSEISAQWVAIMAPVGRRFQMMIRVYAAVRISTYAGIGVDIRKLFEGFRNPISGDEAHGAGTREAGSEQHPDADDGTSDGTASNEDSEDEDGDSFDSEESTAAPSTSSTLGSEDSEDEARAVFDEDEAKAVVRQH